MKMKIFLSTAAGLAQSVERSTAEREAAGSIPGTGPKVLPLPCKWLDIAKYMLSTLTLK